MEDNPVPFVSGPVASVGCLLRGLKLLAHPGLRHFVWIPLLVNMVLYSLGAWLGAHYFTALLNSLIPAWLEWLRWLLWPLFALLLFGIAFFSFTVVANLLASPFYGVLAEKVEQTLGSTPSQTHRSPGAWAEFSAALQRIGYFGLRALPIVALSLIPGVNALAPFLWMAFGAWSLALEYLAYPLEARGHSFSQQRELLKVRRLDALSFGGAISLGLAVPLLNILIPPAAVVGAVLFCAGRRQNSA